MHEDGQLAVHPSSHKLVRVTSLFFLWCVWVGLLIFLVCVLRHTNLGYVRVLYVSLAC